MARCIILIGIAVLSNHVAIRDSVDETTKLPFLECMHEHCQLWDNARGCCGLKQSTAKTSFESVEEYLKNIDIELHNMNSALRNIENK